MQHTVKDRSSEIRIMEDLAPFSEWLVGREDHWLPSQIPPVDDVVEHVCGVLPEGQVADFVDDEDGRGDVALEGLLHPSLLGGNGELLDQFGGGDEEGIEAVEDGLVRNGDR